MRNWCLEILLLGLVRKKFSLTCRWKRGGLGAEDFIVRHQIVVALWGFPIYHQLSQLPSSYPQQKYDFLPNQKYGRFQQSVPCQLPFKKTVFDMTRPVDCNITKANLRRDEKWFWSWSEFWGLRLGCKKYWLVVAILRLPKTHMADVADWPTGRIGGLALE